MAETELTWQEAQFKLTDTLTVEIGDLTLKQDDLIVLIGGNGSGKTSIARAFNKELLQIKGQSPQKLYPQLVSFESQMKLFEDDYNMRNSDATTQKEERGITPRDLLEGADTTFLNEVIKGMNLEKLLDTPIRILSGGEGRKVLLAKALCSRPNLLIFDTPFDALDVNTRQALKELIDEIHTRYRTPIILIVNRPEEIPGTITAMGIIQNGSISRLSTYEEIKYDPDASVLLGYAGMPDVTLPRTPAKFALLPLKDGPLVEIRNLNVTYQREIFNGLNFKVNPGEHWQIIGPNGAGKSTLLSFITGDNPLVYANDVTVFGYKRGSGESIWDIKKNLGVVSGALHLDYRVSAPAINVVLSGFYDSIGLYKQPGDDEISTARQWLQLAGMKNEEHQSFRTLSFGKQRMLLIIRALVKNPPLLILDEPLQGLDGYARALVRSFITYIMAHGRTSVLFVSHHEEDIPEGFTHRLQFIKNADGFDIQQRRL
ncbi:MAG: molybdate ABC transporter ATP-binding protein ModF [Succinivibrio sp.]|nr:molybdate ABC transporter ATP-binding protein ModF [Succinivibrio sp.]